MRATQDKMYRLVGRTRGRLDDFFDGWMTAPHNENDPVGRVDRQRDFLHFQVDTPGAIQQYEVKAWRNLGCPRHPTEIAARPRASETKRLRRFAVEISHFRWQRFVASVESARQGRADHPEVLLRRVNFSQRVNLEKVV